RLAVASGLGGRGGRNTAAPFPFVGREWGGCLGTRPAVFVHGEIVREVDEVEAADRLGPVRVELQVGQAWGGGSRRDRPEGRQQEQPGREVRDMDRALQDLPTAEQRLAEIARLLAGALLLLNDRAGLPSAQAGAGQIPRNSAPNCLEVTGHPRLSVHTG